MQDQWVAVCGKAATRSVLGQNCVVCHSLPSFVKEMGGWMARHGMGWDGVGWAGLGWAGLGWAGWVGGRVMSKSNLKVYAGHGPSWEQMRSKQEGFFRDDPCQKWQRHGACCTPILAGRSKAERLLRAKNQILACPKGNRPEMTSWFLLFPCFNVRRFQRRAFCLGSIKGEDCCSNSWTCRTSAVSSLPRLEECELTTASAFRCFYSSRSCWCAAWRLDGLEGLPVAPCKQ